MQYYQGPHLQFRISWIECPKIAFLWNQGDKTTYLSTYVFFEQICILVEIVDKAEYVFLFTDWATHILTHATKSVLFTSQKGHRWPSNDSVRIRD